MRHLSTEDLSEMPVTKKFVIATAHPKYGAPPDIAADKKQSGGHNNGLCSGKVENVMKRRRNGRENSNNGVAGKRIKMTDNIKESISSGPTRVSLPRQCKSIYKRKYVEESDYNTNKKRKVNGNDNSKSTKKARHEDDEKATIAPDCEIESTNAYSSNMNMGAIGKAKRKLTFTDGEKDKIRHAAIKKRKLKRLSEFNQGRQTLCILDKNISTNINRADVVEENSSLVNAAARSHQVGEIISYDSRQITEANNMEFKIEEMSNTLDGVSTIEEVGGISSNGSHIPDVNIENDSCNEAELDDASKSNFLNILDLVNVKKLKRKSSSEMEAELTIKKAKIEEIRVAQLIKNSNNDRGKNNDIDDTVNVVEMQPENHNLRRSRRLQEKSNKAACCDKKRNTFSAKVIKSKKKPSNVLKKGKKPESNLRRSLRLQTKYDNLLKAASGKTTSTPSIEPVEDNNKMISTVDVHYCDDPRQGLKEFIKKCLVHFSSNIKPKVNLMTLKKVDTPNWLSPRNKLIQRLANSGQTYL